MKNLNNQIHIFSQMKRTTEWLRLAGTSGGRLVQPPAQAHFEFVAQDCVQMVFECLQGWGLYNLPDQPAPVLHHPHSEKVLC